MQTIRVWDLPLRLFHWLLAAAVAAAVITGQIGGNLMIWHGRLGVLIAGLIGFRLAAKDGSGYFDCSEQALAEMLMPFFRDMHL